MGSKEQIVLLMLAHQTVTAKKLAREVQLKPLSVRFHLMDLMGRKWVAKIGDVHTGKSGRPAFQYHLTELGRTEAHKIAKQFHAFSKKSA